MLLGSPNDEEGPVNQEQVVPSNGESDSSFSTLEQDAYVFVEKSHSFEAMFGGDLAESQQEKVVLNGVEVTALRSLLHYAYTGQVTIKKDNVQALLSAANLLEVLPVRDACCGFMERHMDETNCVGIHCFAETHDCAELQQKSKDFILRTFSEVLHQEEFLNISVTKLIELVSSDNLVVSKEEEVFEAVLVWLTHCLDERGKHFEKVLPFVRLPLLSPYYLHDHVATLPAVTESPEGKRILDEAISYHLMPDRRKEQSNFRMIPRRSQGVVDMVVLSGGEDDKVMLKTVECFDPGLVVWHSLQCLPFAVSKHGMVVTGSNTLYVAGGECPDGALSDTVWRYDPVCNQWVEVEPMNQHRSELGLAVLDGHMYAVGGWEWETRLSSVERYDFIQDKWRFVSPMAVALTSPAVIALKGLLYVAGGSSQQNEDGASLVQAYNPTKDSWSLVAPLLAPRFGAGICVLNGLIYVIGGCQPSVGYTNSVESFDSEKNQWKICPPMKQKRYRPGVTTLHGKIYVCGGEDGFDQYHKTIECYCPEQNQWNIVAGMQTPRSWVACATLRVSAVTSVQEG
ncbi:kelch-like protein 18 isoform X2 [Limulus polyphemus]|uniref:Kelch-like protein diablo n=1 Tax=Limulus polyphemus TaxID=6850 RepID=A0ABM1SL75_LIMPO|nr:kelch-like protein 18 isoform X2 [Limulus polyphemus]